MTSQSRHSTLLDVVVAEFAKIYAFRIPQIAYLSIAAFLSLFAIQLFYLERLSDHIVVRSAIDIMPYLFFASWKTILFQLFLVAFSSYCVAVDSQYGMIRIGCTQPVSRAQYLVGKSLAIELHVALLALVYVLSLFLWACICAGIKGLSAASVVPLGSLAGRTIVFCVGLSGCMIAVSAFRKTCLDAVVCACAVFACFALLTTLPQSLHVGGLLFLRYFFYPMAAIAPADWPIPFPMRDAPLWQFLLVSAATPLACFLPALLHFRLRDIAE